MSTEDVTSLQLLPRLHCSFFLSNYLKNSVFEIIIHSTPYMNGRATTRGVFKAYVVFFSDQIASFAEGYCFNQPGRHAERVFIQNVLQPLIHPAPQPPKGASFTLPLNSLSATRFTQAQPTGSSLYPLSQPFANGGIISLWMNYSPCSDCARLLYNLAAYSNFALNIHYIKLYKCEDIFPVDKRMNVAALVQLQSLLPKVSLYALTPADYACLFSKPSKMWFPAMIPFTHHLPSV